MSTAAPTASAATPASSSSRSRACLRKMRLPSNRRSTPVPWTELSKRSDESETMEAGTLRIISLLTLGLIWEIAGRTGNDHLLPPLSKVLTVWLELLVTGQLFHALAISLQALFIGFFISVLFGVPLGLLMGRYRRLESFLDVYMTALLSVPMISFIPFLVIAFGLGLQSRVWIVFLFAFVIIAINTTAGVRNVDPTLTEMARSFGARESELFLKVILPAAMPMIMAGIRLGMGRAVLGMVTS